MSCICVYEGKNGTQGLQEVQGRPFASSLGAEQSLENHADRTRASLDASVTAWNKEVSMETNTNESTAIGEGSGARKEAPGTNQHGNLQVGVGEKVAAARQAHICTAYACDIIIATPASLENVVASRRIDLSSVKYTVMDELDKMLERGCEPHIRNILAHTHKRDRQTLMFTETWPKEVITCPPFHPVAP